MKYANSLLELIGNTPLVKLNRTVGDAARWCSPRSSTSTPAGR